MADSVSVARPYARAAFEVALAQKDLMSWGQFFEELAEVLRIHQVIEFLKSPEYSVEEQVELLLKCLGEQREKTQHHFLEILARAKRLLALPEITRQFKVYKQNHERVVEVELHTFFQLSEEYCAKLQQALEQRLKRRVQLTVQMDPTTLGGALIKADDLVIDATVSTLLKQCAKQLIN